METNVAAGAQRYIPLDDTLLLRAALAALGVCGWYKPIA